MKPLLLLTLFIFSLGVHAQRITTLVLEDAAGLRDTVYFGQQNGATPGIDPALGEIDISSVPMGLSEMRFVSRAPQSCFFNVATVFRTFTYESKADFRGSVPGAYLDWFAPNYGLTPAQMEENTFNIKIRCSSLPCTLSAITQAPFLMQAPYYSLFFNGNGERAWETDCNGNGAAVNNGGVLSSSAFPGLIEEIRQLPGRPQDTTFYMTLFVYNSITSLPRSLRELNLRVHNQELVAGNELFTPQHVAVVDMLGREQFQQVWPGGQQQLALPALNGIYLVRLRYQDGHTAVVRHRFSAQ